MASERERHAAGVLLQALDVFEAAASAPTPAEAVPVARRVVDRLDEAEVRSVAVALAVEAVWKLPPAEVVPAAADARRTRLAQVRRWVRKIRLEAWWVVS